jgi:protein gp37
MGMLTKIQWCHHTFNPWRGCIKISDGCAHCYAEAQSVRNPRVLGEWGQNGRRAIAGEDYWRQPIRWARAAAAAGERRRVFCASLADVFEDNAQVVDARERLFDTIEATPELDWLLLTKRPENVRILAASDIGWDVFQYGLPPNVWLGASIESHEWLWRASALMEIPASVRFLSLEPLLAGLAEIKASIGSLSRFMDRGEYGDRFAQACPREVYPFLGMKAIPDSDWNAHGGKIHWVIVGGESGPHARPCDVMWIAELVRACRAAGCAVFVKQLGTRPVANGLPVALADPKGGDPDEWPAGFDFLKVREFPVLTPPETH